MVIIRINQWDYRNFERGKDKYTLNTYIIEDVYPKASASNSIYIPFMYLDTAVILQ